MTAMDGVYIEYLGYSLPLPLGETVIGRDVQCTLRFNDPSVSRRHLRLVRRQEEIFVEDLGSSNGTLLNGRKLTGAVRVDNGDTIQLGSRSVVVRFTDEPVDEITLVLKEPLPAQPANPLRSFQRPSTNIRFASSTTQPMPVVMPPGYQRCPSCAAPVSEVDDECANCHYNWGSFRPASRTDVRGTPIRRRHPREPVELPLRYVSSELEIEAMTRDLSEGGVFVCSQVLDPVGTTCHLTMLVDGGPPLAIDGIVRRVVEHGQESDEGTGLGVQFTGVTEHQLAWIRTLIEQLREDSDDESHPS